MWQCLISSYTDLPACMQPATELRSKLKMTNLNVKLHTKLILKYTVANEVFVKIRHQIVPLAS